MQKMHDYRSNECQNFSNEKLAEYEVNCCFYVDDSKTTYITFENSILCQFRFNTIYLLWEWQRCI